MVESVEDEIRELRTLFWSERDPEGRAFAPLADAYRRQGDLGQALELLEDGLGRHSSFAPGHIVAAWVRRDRGEVEEADREFGLALALDEENSEALRGLGELAAGRGDHESAAAHYQKLIELEPGDLEIVARLREIERAVASPTPAAPVLEIPSYQTPSFEPAAVEPPALEIPSFETHSFDAPLETSLSIEPAPDEEEAPLPMMEGTFDAGSLALEAPLGLDELPLAPGALDRGEPDPADWAAPEITSSEPAPMESASLAETAPVGEEVPPALDPGLDFTLDVPPVRDAALSGLPMLEPEPEAEVANDLPMLSPQPAAPAIEPAADDEGPITRTMADLYARQGLHDRALRVFRRLLERSPDDDTLKTRVKAMEALIAAAPLKRAPAPAPAKPRTEEPAAAAPVAERPAASAPVLEGPAAPTPPPPAPAAPAAPRAPRRSSDVDVEKLAQDWAQGPRPTEELATPFAWKAKTAAPAPAPTSDEPARPVRSYFQGLLGWEPPIEPPPAPAPAPQPAAAPVAASVTAQAPLSVIESAEPAVPPTAVPIESLAPGRVVAIESLAPDGIVPIESLGPAVVPIASLAP